MTTLLFSGYRPASATAGHCKVPRAPNPELGKGGFTTKTQSFVRTKYGRMLETSIGSAAARDRSPPGQEQLSRL